MSKPGDRKPVRESDIFGDLDFDPETFVETMEQEDGSRWRASSGRGRPAWRRLEDYYEWRWMREQLYDWEDWELD